MDLGKNGYICNKGVEGNKMGDVSYSVWGRGQAQCSYYGVCWGVVIKKGSTQGKRKMMMNVQSFFM